MSDVANIPTGILGSGERNIDEISSSISRANNYLGLRLLKSWATTEGNVFFSPFSISVAFAMLYRGADGQTAQELRRGLGYEWAGVEESTLHQQFRDVLESLSADSENVLSIANALLCQVQFPLLADYKSELDSVYSAKIREVDFTHDSETIVEEINQWVREKTRNKIDSLFDSLDPETVVVLLNAAYFKGVWNTQFKPEITQSRPFYNFGDESKAKNVPTMYIEAKFNFIENEFYQMIELPYIGKDIVMVVILPTKRDGLSEIRNALLSGTLNFSKDHFRYLSVHLNLPKFFLNYSTDMKEVLKDLGMGGIFSPSQANLQKMCPSAQIYVSQVRHKAALEVNEEGTIAAAVTGIAVNSRCLRLEPEIVCIVDHPFLMTIVDKSKNMILFMGQVLEL